MLDVPHWFSKYMAKRAIMNSESPLLSELKKKLESEGKYNPQEEKESKIIKDLYEFDIAFNVAYNEVVYMIILLYMIICPSISILGAAYFCIKYYIDKYNLIVVYPKSTDGSGDISKNINKLAQVNLILVEIFMFTFLSNTLDHDASLLVIGSLVLFQLTTYFISKCINVKKWEAYYAKQWNFMDKKDEMEYEFKLNILD